MRNRARSDLTSPLTSLISSNRSLTHIIKLHPFTPRTNNFVLHALIELLDHPGDVQVQATFAIARLVADDSDLQLIACESYDVIKKLAGLLEKSSIVTTPGYGNGNQVGSAFSGRVAVPVDEGLIRLREVSLKKKEALSWYQKSFSLTTNFDSCLSPGNSVNSRSSDRHERRSDPSTHRLQQTLFTSIDHSVFNSLLSGDPNLSNKAHQMSKSKRQDLEN